MRSRSNAQLRRLVALWFAGTLIIPGAAPQRAAAQSPAEPWATPANLSHSGTATNPAIVIDAIGVVHAVWRDTSADLIYARLEGGEWSPPLPTDLRRRFGLPSADDAARGGTQSHLYTGPNPLFLAGPGQLSFAIWVTPEGQLYSSRVLNRDFGVSLGWATRRLISTSVASFASAVDPSGNVHVAFYRITATLDNPPGIYYTRSSNGSLDWEPPTRVYESPYFRALGEGEASLSLATAGTVDAPIVYLAWDNRPRKQVFVATSMNGGATWGTPDLVDGPSPDSGSARPFNIRVGAAGTTAMLIWQNGEPGGTCTQSYKSSADGGTTWSGAQIMMGGLPGCATANEFVVGLEHSLQGLLYLLTDFQGQSYLTVWRGSRWSEPQAQPILSGFEEPETYTPISLGCHRAAGFGALLYVVGCDQGEGGDIWITSRDVGSTESWFSPQAWTQPVPVSGAEMDVSSLELVPTSDGLVHAVFSQRQGSVIDYTRWDGATWSRITPVLKLPNEEVNSPAIAAGPENELFLIALSGDGALHYVLVKSRDAATASRWSTPTRLPIEHDGPVSPADVAWDSAGTVYVAYSIPVYEARGVYLITTPDEGETWSGPMQVFDGAAAGFDLVGSPVLLVTPDGHIHIQWKRQSIAPDGASQGLSLYHSWSEDSGRTFSEPELVIEAPVTWHTIVADGEGNLHRLWQRSDSSFNLWDQVSVDGGDSWQVPQQLPVAAGHPAVTVDPAGQLHLLGSRDGSLGHWRWNGSRWGEEVTLPLAAPQDGRVELLASAINTEGEFMVLERVLTNVGEEATGPLQYMTRRLSLPAGQAATPGGPTLAPSPTNAPATPAGELPVTPPAESETPAPVPIDSGDQRGPSILTLLPTAVLLLAVLGFAIWRGLRGRAR